MKKCSKCNEEKDINCFYKKTKDKLHSQCKVCQSIEHKKWYLKNVDKVKNKTRLSNKKIKIRNIKYVVDYKTSIGCKYCGEKESCCLDFHHNGNKILNISRLARNSNSIKVIETEIKKCTVVCANCHRKLHYGSLR